MPRPVFNEFAKQVFTAAISIMGMSAVWHSSDGAEINGGVLFNTPTEPEKLGNANGYEYKPNNETIEYYDDTFVGLREAVDSGKEEYVTVNERDYLVLSVAAKFDGRTLVASITPHEQP